ncbi:probable low-specificity L-threonine aldolase 2 isoform X2 [Venturia canescens]|uniref:probable low-specificity L-threonine aldolase 2 isoform X2 n=1 Tax=Venturia canescens TaxID=32260 RepID=UPI001C9BF47C|nr:probable low-specificity L-threonine aldolase 2 isoform X2 [Venturia canescens]
MASYAIRGTLLRASKQLLIGPREMSSYGAQLDVNINDYAKEKNAIIVDLRSDTVTKPSKAMRLAMMDAAVGDDVFGEDPTVNELERKAAEMVGKEAALFVSSGTMGNLIAIMVHCNERGCQAYCGERSHTMLHEQGGAAQIAGVTLNPIPNREDGTFSLEALELKFSKDRLHEPTSRLVIVENTFTGNTVDSCWLNKLMELVKKRGLKLHMDGARLWNASVGSGVPANKMVENFDSVTFCLSKGLGAPVGSMLCGDRDFISRARRVRKVLGGGMRQAGVLAAAGLVALEETIPLLKFDHERARRLESAINQMESNVFQSITDTGVKTNMVILRLNRDLDYGANAFVQRLSTVLDEPNEPRIIVRALAFSNNMIRFVLHRDINDEMLDAAISKIKFIGQPTNKKKM